MVLLKRKKSLKLPRKRPRIKKIIEEPNEINLLVFLLSLDLGF